jgi:hypothetical protein
MSGTLAWLRGRSDGALARLLRARPDLVVPAPGDLEVLARRLDSPPSVWRVMEGLDAFAVQILQALVLLDAQHRSVEAADVVAFFGPATDRAALLGTLDRVQDLGLVRDPGLRIPRSVVDVLSPYPAGLGRKAGLDPAVVAEKLDRLSADARAVLDRLVPGPPVGALSDGRPVPAGVEELLAAGLLHRIDKHTVELPLEVGVAMRGGPPLGPTQPDPPAAPVLAPGLKTVDATAAGQALAALGRVGRLLDLIGHRPVSVLKSGGLGIRELRRLGKELELDDHLAALYVELVAAAGLLGAADARGRREPSSHWTPTHAADEFLAADPEQAWSQLAEVWLDLRRDPARVGGKDDTGRLQNALAAELAWTRGPADRRFVLGVLAAMPPGTGRSRDDLTALLAWQAPLRSTARRNALLSTTLIEATELGVVAFDVMGTAGRALLVGDLSTAAETLAAAMPPAVDTVLVQADLTIVAPGRLDAELAARLEQAADVESAGSATVYRVTPASLRRALDGGMTTGDLHELFEAHSATGVPQSLSYLIDDVGRRYGRIRTGIANTYLHSEDPALVAEAIAAAGAAGVTLRRLAPTVAIGMTEVEELHQVLADAGLAPVAEDATGKVLDLRRRPRRTQAGLVTHQRWREPPVPSDDQLAGLIARMRSADAVSVESGQTPAAQLTILRDAVTQRRPVWISYVNSAGMTTRRMIEPVGVAGGRVAAFDPLHNQMRQFALHRITAVSTTLPDE